MDSGEIFRSPELSKANTTPSDNITLQNQNNDHFSPHSLLLLIAYGIAVLFSAFGNLCALLVFAVGKRNRTDLRPFLISLSISDLLMGMLSIN